MRKIQSVLCAVLILSVMFMFSSCSSEMDKENAEKQAAIVGAWIVADGSDVGQSENGQTYVNVFEFTADGRQNYHQVFNDSTITYPMGEYEIYDGNLKSSTTSGAQLAKISFENNFMTMGSTTAQRVYRKLTDEELSTYKITLGSDPDADAEELEEDTEQASETSETASESVSE